MVWGSMNEKKPPLSHVGARERGRGGGVDGARQVHIALRVCACVEGRLHVDAARHVLRTR